MSYIVTFTDFEPSPREDGLPWTEAQVQEAATVDGTYTLIDTLALTPLDADPADPQPRSFTTELATLQDGWYRITFVDGDGNTSPADPVRRISYMPSVADVAAHLGSRTFDANGRDLGTFTANTRPTDGQVQLIIDRESGKLAAKFGPDVAPALLDDAREVIALRTAMLIELNYFADQIRAQSSPYAELKDLYEEALADFLLDRKVLGADGIAGTPDDLSSAGLPAYDFPTLGPPAHAPGSETANDCGGGWDW